ncbi:MAG: winged helix-turn-helix domain-containing protein [Pyrinomonadaceae bacterium]
MQQLQHLTLSFDDFTLDLTRGCLLRGAVEVRLRPKSFEVLKYLAESGGRLVSKDELIEAVWVDTAVTDDSLVQCLIDVRRALGDASHRYIKTVTRRGYIFEAEVVRHDPSGREMYDADGRSLANEEEPRDEGRSRGIASEMQNAQTPSSAEYIVGQLKRHRVPSLTALVILLTIGGLGFWYFNSRPASTSRIESIAVLPLKSLSPEADDQYLGLGIADSIIARISQIEALTVRPTSAVRKYVNSEVDSLEAAREQKVDFVLDGTVQRSGDRLRVSINLLRVSDGSSLWADIFNLNFSDIFAVQDKVSQQIASRLRLKLNVAEAARLARRNASNPEAFNYYTKAVYHFYNIGPDLSTRSESDLAIDLFKKAIELDPGYALAHAQLGYTYTKIAVFQEENPAWIEQAKKELAIAERLNPQLAEVHAARFFAAFSQYENWNIETAFRELRLAQEIDPDVAHGELADLYNHIGMEDKSIEEFETALQIDPNNDSIKEAYIALFYQVNHADLALDLSKRFFNRDSSLQYYLEKMMAKEAEPLIEIELKKAVVSDTTRMQKIVLLSLQSKHDEAQAAGLKFIENVRKNRGYHHYAYNTARVFAQAGNSEEALNWLRYTADNGFPCYPLFERDRYLDPIRKDPEFRKLLAEMKEQWEGYVRNFE